MEYFYIDQSQLMSSSEKSHVVDKRVYEDGEFYQVAELTINNCNSPGIIVRFNYIYWIRKILIY